MTGCRKLEPEVYDILENMVPYPASVLNGRSDLLAWNRSYALLFPFMVNAPEDKRNVLWQTFTVPGCCHPFLNRREELGRMVANFRHRYGQHIGEPAWEDFVKRLCAASPQFAELWAEHDVAEAGVRMKIFRHPGLGELKTVTTQMEIIATPGARMTFYTPGDADTAEKFKLLGGDSLPSGTYACGHTFEAPSLSVMPMWVGGGDDRASTGYA